MRPAGCLSIAVLAGLCLAALLTIGVIGCSESGPDLAAPEAPAGTTTYTMDRREHKFGDVFDTRVYNTSFTMTNTGRDELVIEDVRTSCQCSTATAASTTVAPGKSTTIDVEYKPIGPGGRINSIYVTTNASPKVCQVTIDGFVKQFVTIDPVNPSFERVMMGRNPMISFHAHCVDPDFEVVAAVPSTPWITATTYDVTASNDPERPGKARIQLELSPQTPWGQLDAEVVVTFSGRDEPGAELTRHTVPVKVRAVVESDLVARPSKINFPVTPSGKRLIREVMIASIGGIDFDVTTAAVVDCGITGLVASPVREAGGWRIRVSGVAPEQVGVFRGILEVRTNLEGGDGVLRIPLQGAVQ